MILSGHNNSCCGTNVPGHKRVWAQSCLGTNQMCLETFKRLGTNVSGHKCVWAQTCLGTNASRHKRVWTQLCFPISCAINE